MGFQQLAKGIRRFDRGKVAENSKKQCVPWGGWKAFRLLELVCILMLFVVSAVFAKPDNEILIEPAIVAIEVTQQRPDWYSPWQRTRPSQSSGSGFLIGPGRVMTNAHVVSDAKQIIVRRNQDNRPFFAEIEYIAHDSDLATLRVKDPAFDAGVQSLRLGGLPSLRSHVRTYGFPAGGEKISRTEGVVSRIQFITYLHSSADSHLGVQTDSAINPGNSGGPVIQEGSVIGVAFQTNTRLNDVGYFIPTPVIRRFLKDSEDGRYDGYGDLGIATSNLINPTYRRFKKLPSNQIGVAVDRIHPLGSAEGFVKDGDVVVAIDGITVMADGTINFKGFTLNFEQMVEEKLLGETVNLTVWRNGMPVEIGFPLKRFPISERMRSKFDTFPRYLVHAGLVFMELDREYLKTFGNYWENADKHLLYAHFFKFLESGKKPETRVVLARVLPHRINRPYSGMVNKMVETLNGVPIRRLEDISEGLKENGEKFHRLILEPGGQMLVLDKKEATKAHPEILQKYGITRDRRLN